MLNRVKEYDTDLLIFLNNLGSQQWDPFWLAVTDKLTFLPFFLLIIYFLYKENGFYKLLFILLSIALLILFTDQFTNVIKDSFERLRPCRVDELQQYLRNIEVRCGKYGFFSAHAANSMAVTTLLISSFKFCYKKWISLLLIFWVVFFSYSRIYLGVHYPLDTFFGLFFGLLFGRTAHYIINYINFIEKIKETE
jgi:undecaprenyl-diphosphatase